jgi:hypothetical protein
MWTRRSPRQKIRCKSNKNKLEGQREDEGGVIWEKDEEGKGAG